jgi:hypothetical protein
MFVWDRDGRAYTIVEYFPAQVFTPEVYFIRGYAGLYAVFGDEGLLVCPD